MAVDQVCGELATILMRWADVWSCDQGDLIRLLETYPKWRTVQEMPSGHGYFDESFEQSVTQSMPTACD